MTTAMEFVKAGITGQTFGEITEQFKKPFNTVAQEDPVMGNYAIAFAWYREKEHLPIPEAYAKAMKLTTAQVEGLFEDETPEVKAVVDFASPPPKTTP